MHARIVTTKERKYGDFVRRESSPVPGVQLFDSNESKPHKTATIYSQKPLSHQLVVHSAPVNVAALLVQERFALESLNAVAPIVKPAAANPAHDQQRPGTGIERKSTNGAQNASHPNRPESCVDTADK